MLPPSPSPFPSSYVAWSCSLSILPTETPGLDISPTLVISLSPPALSKAVRLSRPILFSHFAHSRPVVKVKHEEVKPLPAKTLTVAVRCYESRLGRVNVIATNVLVNQTLVLWEKSPASASAEVPDGDYPFKLVIPPDTPGLTTTIFQEYRAYWRVEAVLEHLPIFGVGNRLVRHFELPLLRYDTPSHSPSSPPPPAPIPIQSPKSRLPIYHCAFSTPPPSSPIGPGDLVSTFLQLQPIDPSFSIRSATMSIERRLDLRLPVDNLSAHTPSPTPPDASTESFSSLVDQSSSKSASTTVVTSETFEFPLDPTGSLSKTITAQWPPRKKHSWTIGETMTSDLVTVKFYIHLRVSGRRFHYLPRFISLTYLSQLSVFSPQTGPETIEMAEREVIVVSTNQSERQVASVKSKDKASSLRSKSRSPHRKHTSVPNPPGSQSGASAPAIQRATKSSPLPAGRPRMKSSRRPHTSAGPRDTSNLPFRSEFELHERSTDLDDRIFPPTNLLPKKPRSARPVLRDSYTPTKTYTVVHHDGNNHIIFQPISLDHVRDWEEELARIELRSRRSSADMLGFRKR